MPPQTLTVTLVSLEVLYGALLFFLLLKPEWVKNATWFKLAVIVFAGNLALNVLWMIFDAIGGDVARVFASLSGGISSALLGVSIFFLLLGQVGSVAGLKEKAKAEAKK